MTTSRKGSPHQLALRATVHCLTGCSIGEVLGMVLGTTFGWSNLTTIVVAIALAFVFGYTLTLIPLRRAGLGWKTVLGLALASDTLSITLMEIVDNTIMLLIPGAMDAPLSSPLFWGSMAASLLIAGLAALPVEPVVDPSRPRPRRSPCLPRPGTRPLQLRRGSSSSQQLHHEGTKNTKGTKNCPAPFGSFTPLLRICYKQEQQQKSSKENNNKRQNYQCGWESKYSFVTFVSFVPSW